MKIQRLFLIIGLALLCATSCGSSDKIYWEFYKPDPKEDPDPGPGPEPGTYTVKVISFNVRYENTSDPGDTAWEKRKVAVPTMFADQKPDLLGVQEARHAQKTYMDETCKGYKSIGVGRTNGVTAGEYMAIYYRTETMKLDSWGTFWLSETPGSPSIGWDASTYRTATYSVFTHIESGQKFFYINTHLDHQSSNARAKSMVLIEEKIKELNKNDYPVLLTADFNTTINDVIFNGVKAFMKDARTSAPKTDYEGSYNGWGASNSIIDHIFYCGFTPLKFETVKKAYEGFTYISDHYPVAAELQFKVE